MPDVGLGIVDRRTITAIIITMLLAQWIPGTYIPIDTSSPIPIIRDVTWLTACFWLARTLIRSLIALLLTPMFMVMYRKRVTFSRWEGGSKLWHELVARQNWAGIPNEAAHGFGGSTYYPSYTTPFARFVAVIERGVVVGLAVVAVFPQLRYMVDIAGTIGAATLIAVYILKGGFSLLLKDQHDKAEEDRERLIMAAGSQPSFPSVIQTRPAYDS